MPVAAAPLALSLAPVVAQAVQAGIQNKKAKKLKPSNFIPPAIREAESTARQIAQSTQMPGQDRFEARLGKNTANTLAAARRSTSNPAALLEAVQEADARAKGAIADNKTNLDAFKLQGQNLLSNALAKKGAFQQANRDAYNAAKSALTGASQQNLYNAITNASNVGVAAAGGMFGTPAAGAKPAAVPGGMEQIVSNTPNATPADVAALKAGTMTMQQFLAKYNPFGVNKSPQSLINDFKIGQISLPKTSKIEFDPYEFAQ